MASATGSEKKRKQRAPAASAKSGPQRRTKPAVARRQTPAKAPAAPAKPSAAATPKPAVAQHPQVRVAPPPVRALAAVQLTEEERIESAKYLPHEAPRRRFEAERFLFPESYGVDRVRLMVKDPYWLFAHWDVSAASLKSLETSLGARTAALVALTLRVSDPNNGGVTTILLPRGARSWYVRTDATSRFYRAELGVTLPSGEFRHLASSNTVQTPRVGPSRRKVRQVVKYGEASALPQAQASLGSRPAAKAARPWSGPRASAKGTAETPNGYDDGAWPAEETRRERGGASDVHRR